MDTKLEDLRGFKIIFFVSIDPVVLGIHNTFLLNANSKYFFWKGVDQTRYQR